MANSTMLALVARACGEMGLPVPTSVATNTAADTVQMFYLLNGLGSDLMREWEWEQINRAHLFTVQYLTTTGTWTTAAATVTAIPTTSALSAVTWQATGTGIPQNTNILTVDSATQVTLDQTPTAAGTAAAITFGQVRYSMPADFDRIIDETQWDKSKHWEMLGPETAQQWEWLLSGYISTGPRIRWRIMGDYFQIWPLTSTSDVLGFGYVSKYWVLSAAAANNVGDKALFSVDTDTCIFQDRLMVTGLKLRYFQAKGFDTASIESQYQAALDNAKATDKGAATLSMAPRAPDILITYSNIPDSNFG